MEGGVLGIIVDEAVLNTPDFGAARAFIRKNYFLKAVVSLPRDAFADMAKTTAKTSILVLIKKDDPSVLQRDLVLFARALRTGPTSKDMTRPNDLVPICDAFDRWRDRAVALCIPTGGVLQPPDIQKAREAMLSGKPGDTQVSIWSLDPNNQTERLDEAYWCMKDIVNTMPSTQPFSDFANLISEGRIPPERDVYAFGMVSRVDVRVKAKQEGSTRYTATDLRTLKAGDILLSGIDLVHGSVGVVEPDCEGRVVSKEYYILRAKPGIDAHFLVALLRTPAMRRVIEGTITGTSNRTRVESVDVLMGLPLPPLPDHSVQVKIGNRLRRAHAHQTEMLADLRGSETDAALAAGLAILAESEAPEQEPAD